MNAGDYRSFNQVYTMFSRLFEHESILVHTERWQGIDIAKKPEAAMHEILMTSFRFPMMTADLDHHRKDIRPNLPWADDHFLERVCGEPLNPGVTWKDWPHALSADKFRENGQFNHNYMERYWPKQAGYTPDGQLIPRNAMMTPRRGIRHSYGDLANVVSLLCEEPLTRQAYLPVWFPEDTGDIHAGRKPCTLGYHFIVRNNKLHVVYYIRSCDFVRHFRDDVYLTIRLALWIMQQCRQDDATRAPEYRRWDLITPGDFVMHITSLHMFRNDFISMYGRSGT